MIYGLRLKEKDISGGWETLRNTILYTDISDCNKSEHLGTVSKTWILVAQISKCKKNSPSKRCTKDGKKDVYNKKTV